MTTIASQITSLTVVYSIVYSDADQRKHQTPRHWPLCGEFTGTGEFPAQRASYAENVSIWWRHHEIAPVTTPKLLCNNMAIYRIHLTKLVVGKGGPSLTMICGVLADMWEMIPSHSLNNHHLRAISHKMLKISIIDTLYHITAVSQRGHWFDHSPISLRHSPFGCRTGRRRTASGMRPYCKTPWMTSPIPCRHHVLASSHPWSARK